jgi:NAD(P)-dependent dehydrogenase (short-subunit alcohol dehydrogenase family)
VILAPASEKRAGQGQTVGRLEGKVAVITGASTGIGLASAQRFAAEGAHVFLAGRRKQELDAAVAKTGRKSRGVQCDVSNLGDLDRLFAVVREEAGTIDILFANAGGGEFAALERLPRSNSTEPSPSM